jgi:heme/copper-type cytochrome/quinol oxidase subunit 1
MSEATRAGEPRRYTLMQLLFPSVVSGIVFDVVGAVIVYLIVRAVQPDNQDAQVVFAYIGWTIFFFVGMGAFNGVWKWGFARREDTLEEALELAGKDQGIWRYFRTELISIPTGFFFLALVGTLWRGRIWVTVPLLFVAGMLVNFVIGGITGIYLADLPTDEILHGGMFVTAHFHFTLVGSMVFGFFAAFYYWFPKMLGRRLNPRLGMLHFWLFEIGFVGTFMSLFYAGIQGEPRWSANVSPLYATANLIASLFAILIAASVFVTVYNVVISLARGELATADEWGAKTLEWTVPTPVPLENFEHLPVVTATSYEYGLSEPADKGLGLNEPATPNTMEAPS